MKKSANARFAITNWDEKPYSEGPDLPKLTRATVTKTFTGDIEGEGQVIPYDVRQRQLGNIRRPRAGRRTNRRQSRQLRAPTHRSIRERPGQGILFRRPLLRNRRVERPSRRRHFLRRSRQRSSFHDDVRVGVAGVSIGSGAALTTYSLPEDSVHQRVTPSAWRT